MSGLPLVRTRTAAPGAMDHTKTPPTPSKRADSALSGHTGVSRTAAGLGMSPRQVPAAAAAAAGGGCAFGAAVPRLDLQTALSTDANPSPRPPPGPTDVLLVRVSA